ncbi:MAG: hypothetical protein AB1814_04425 [Thermodesulfobacteriota bacterium]
MPLFYSYVQPSGQARRSARSWRRAFGLVGLLCLGLALAASPAQARWSDRVKQFVEKTRQHVLAELAPAGEQLSPAERQAQDLARRAARHLQAERRQQAQERREALREAAEHERERFQQEARRLRQRFLRQEDEGYRQWKEARQKRALLEKALAARVAQAQAQGGRWLSGLRQRIAETWRAGVSMRHGAQGVREVYDNLNLYGPGAGAAVAVYLKQARDEGVEVVERSRPLIAKISSQVQDPALQSRLILGAIAASAVDYNAGQPQSELALQTLNYCLEGILVPVGQRRLPLKEVISEAVLEKAPYLQDSPLAEDPAAVLAYGTVALGRRDLIRGLPIVPDGRGNLYTVQEAIRRAPQAEDALLALLVGVSLEGMADHASEQGVLGFYGQTFAAAYRNLEQGF